MKQKEIYYDKSGAEAFEKSVIKTAESCNSLIETFESFQDWQKINTLQEWIELVSNPGEYFDKILLTSVNLSTGGRQANPEVLANLVSVDRENYLNITSGKAIIESECKPCQKMRLKKGASAINIYQYQQFENYLVFNAGNFTLNEESVSAHKNSFKVYADTPAKSEIIDYWQSLCDTLNLYHDRYHISADNKIQISKALKLQLSEGVDGRFVVNNQAVSYEILNVKENVGKN